MRLHVLLLFGRHLTCILIHVIGWILLFTILCNVSICKHISASLLLAFYMLSATAIHEVIKLPKLVEHYLDHSREEVQIGLFQYLSLHYGIEDGTDEDAAEDNQLPFKSSEFFSSVSFVSVKPPAINQSLRLSETASAHNFLIRNESYLPSPYLDRIWQPPRQS